MSNRSTKVAKKTSLPEVGGIYGWLSTSTHMGEVTVLYIMLTDKIMISLNNEENQYVVAEKFKDYKNGMFNLQPLESLDSKASRR